MVALQFLVLPVQVRILVRQHEESRFTWLLDFLDPVNTFNMDIIEAMKERRSVRSFNGEGIPTRLVDALNKAAEEASSPFGGDVTIRLKRFDIEGGYRPSTYGVITGARDFFLIAMKDDEASALTAGFRFEQVVLRAWQLGLGSCWIAATFKGSVFDEGNVWNDGERLRIVGPVGFAVKPSFREKITRLAVGSSHRKPFDELFFLEDFNRSLPAGNRFAESLEMMRLAPSSTNSQPWRAVVTDNTVHFYCKPKGSCSIIDCGIGLRHFFEAEKHSGNYGRFMTLDNRPTPPAPLRYVTSFMLMI